MKRPTYIEAMLCHSGGRDAEIDTSLGAGFDSRVEGMIREAMLRAEAAGVPLDVAALASGIAEEADDWIEVDLVHTGEDPRLFEPLGTIESLERQLFMKFLQSDLVAIIKLDDLEALLTERQCKVCGDGAEFHLCGEHAAYIDMSAVAGF